MRKLIMLSVLALICLSPVAAQESNILVDANWLESRMNKGKVVILQIGTKKNFKKEHIPGALFADPHDYTYDDESQNIIFDRPTDEHLKSFFEGKGVSNDTDVVIYTEQNWIPLVTRLYFTLDYLGHGKKTYILDGGLAAWKANGGETSSETATPAKGSFKLKPRESILADTDYMKASIENQGNTIVDCRSEAYYKAIKPTHGARHGRIPSAKNIPYTSLYEASEEIGAYKFKSLEEIETIFNAQGLDKSEPLVLYCHIGMQLTVIYTAAKMLGYEDLKMYDPSFNVWGKDDSLPVEQD